MFGEKTIVGQTILRISKDRIILPDFTYAEPGEEISATLDPYQKKIILLKEKDLIERLDELHKKMKIAREEKRLGYKEYYELERYFWGMLPLHERTLTKKKEYLLFNRKPYASIELRQLERLNLKDEVFAVGTGQALEIYPTEQAFHEYLEFEEERRKKVTK